MGRESVVRFILGMCLETTETGQCPEGKEIKERDVSG